MTCRGTQERELHDPDDTARDMAPALESKRDARDAVFAAGHGNCDPAERVYGPRPAAPNGAQAGH